MVSLIGTFVKGYDLFWMAVWMIVPTIIFTIIAFVRSRRDYKDDRLLGVVGILVIVDVALMEWIATGIKVQRHASEIHRILADNKLAAEMTACEFGSLLLFIWLVTFAVSYLSLTPKRYDIPWSLTIWSCALGLAGTAMDYDEWRQIANNGAYRLSLAVRFPGWLHLSLSILTFALAAAAVVWFAIDWRRSRRVAA